MIRRFSLFGFGKKGSPASGPSRARRVAQGVRPVGSRPVVFIGKGVDVSEGQGMRLTRLIGTPEFDMLDPFLLLDWFSAEPGWRQQVGFSDQPHLGIEAVTYVVSGAIRHTDNRDHDATVEAGGVQWMTASGGIVRAEFAEPRAEPLCGYQLWINLPAREKRNSPAYRVFAAETLPVEERPGAEVVVIAGTTPAGIRGAMSGGATDPLLLAVRLDPDARFGEDVSSSDSAFFVVHDGAVRSFDDAGKAVAVAEGEIAITGAGTRIQMVAGPEGAEILFAAARPLNEPVARAGPIVMNTRAEVMKALRSYREGKL